MIRHFLDIADYSTDQLRQILADAFVMKAKPHTMADWLSGKNIALLFEKPSTRTRISFEVGVNQLGAAPIVLIISLYSMLGETVADTAQVMSRYVDAIMIRAESHDTVMELYIMPAYR